MIALHLPIPPSVNALWRVRDGRPRKSDRYKTWEVAAHGHFLEQGGHRMPKVKGPFQITIILDAARRGNSDADNRVKALLDYLQKGAGIIEDDRYADSVTVRWGCAPVGCTVLIEQAGQLARAAE